jgi:hypothetical protein
MALTQEQRDHLAEMRAAQEARQTPEERKAREARLADMRAQAVVDAAKSADQREAERLLKLLADTQASVDAMTAAKPDVMVAAQASLAAKPVIGKVGA